MLGLDAPELIVIALVVLILFGTKKMPEAARALGRSLRIFKAETRGLREDERADRADLARSPDGPGRGGPGSPGSGPARPAAWRPRGTDAARRAPA